jgi:hypothetical protein
LQTFLQAKKIQNRLKSKLENKCCLNITTKLAYSIVSKLVCNGRTREWYQKAADAGNSEAKQALDQANDPVIKEARFAKSARRLKRGVWGESRLAFESIVEESQAVCGTKASRRLDDRLGLLSVEFLSA